jgi:hypothetical protein
VVGTATTLKSMSVEAILEVDREVVLRSFRRLGDPSMGGSRVMRVVKAEFRSISARGLHPLDLNLGSFIAAAIINDHHYHARLYI